eukprot:gene29786-7423_t
MYFDTNVDMAISRLTEPQVFFMCSVPAATASRHFTHENRIELMRQNIVADTIVDGVGFKFPEY